MPSVTLPAFGRLPFHVEQLVVHSRVFHEIWYMNMFRKSVDIIQVIVLTQVLFDFRFHLGT
jgi:hypothetical protein